MSRAKPCPSVLSVAGSDPSGSAGLQLDLRVLALFGVHPMGVATALTVQTPRGVRAVHGLAPKIVAEQLEALFEDAPPAVVKVGMVHKATHVRTLARLLAAHPKTRVVIDPVFFSTNGVMLSDERAAARLVDDLVPRATVVTPNLAEAALITGKPVVDFPTMRAAAGSLVLMGAAAALVKGGHLDGDPIDVLCVGERMRAWRSQRVRVTPRGTGCALASAIAARLALGDTVEEAVVAARRFVRAAISGACSLGVGPPVLRPPVDTAGRRRRGRRA